MDESVQILADHRAAVVAIGQTRGGKGQEEDPEKKLEDRLGELVANDEPEARGVE